jgi:hypothetical protein
MQRAAIELEFFEQSDEPVDDAVRPHVPASLGWDHGACAAVPVLQPSERLTQVRAERDSSSSPFLRDAVLDVEKRPDLATRLAIARPCLLRFLQPPVLCRSPINLRRVDRRIDPQRTSERSVSSLDEAVAQRQAKASSSIESALRANHLDMALGTPKARSAERVLPRQYRSTRGGLPSRTRDLSFALRFDLKRRFTFPYGG